MESETDPALVCRTRSGKIYTATALKLRPILKNTDRTMNTTSVSYRPPQLVECLALKRVINSAVLKIVIGNLYTQPIGLNPCLQMTFLILTLRTLSSFRVIIGHMLRF